MYLIAGSPITKIFLTNAKVQTEDGRVKPMTRWLKEKPERIMDPTIPFTFTVPRANGGITLKYGEVRDINTLIPINRQGSENVKAVYEYLTGGDDGNFSSETNKFGIAPLNFDATTTNLISTAFNNPDMNIDIKDKLKEQRKRAEEIAHTRVMNQIRFVVNNLFKQYALNKESNQGYYQPTDTEYLAIWVRNKVDNVDFENAQDAKFNEALQEMMVQSMGA